jgi:hypothetical protein
MTLFMFRQLEAMIAPDMYAVAARLVPPAITRVERGGRVFTEPLPAFLAIKKPFCTMVHDIVLSAIAAGITPLSSGERLLGELLRVKS